MIKLVYCVRRKAEIGADEFFRYWLEEHGPLVKSVAQVLNARRYVQSIRRKPRSTRVSPKTGGLGNPLMASRKSGGIASTS